MDIRETITFYYNGDPIEFIFIPKLSTQVLFNKSFGTLFWFDSIENEEVEVYFLTKPLERIPDVKAKAIPLMFQCKILLLTSFKELFILRNDQWILEKIIEGISNEEIKYMIMYQFYKEKYLEVLKNETNFNRNRNNEYLSRITK